ncbi:MAG: hypothetical protein SXQ77_05865 [Halobacteria archaeon]|nr:hypothetical protein [Halobacteria archaeon]
MRAFEHGDYVVIEGSEEELDELADALDDGDEARETAAKIRRGLDKGATRIAVTRERARAVRELGMGIDRLEEILQR